MSKTSLVHRERHTDRKKATQAEKNRLKQTESQKATDRLTDKKRRRKETLKLTETSDRQITAFLTPSQP